MVVKKRAARTRHFGQRMCGDAIKDEVVAKRTEALKEEDLYGVHVECCMIA